MGVHFPMKIMHFAIDSEHCSINPVGKYFGWLQAAPGKPKSGQPSQAPQAHKFRK